ncbi:MAG: hypothetical protein HQK89_13495 [Nitrospirae bacterium]|nr:hypothetical protein [Nitrospirota bacterium]
MKGMKSIFTKLFKSSGGSPDRAELERGLFVKKYESFKALLDANNTVLELMADMEEKLSGEFLFDRHYLVDTAANIALHIKTIADRLNELSGNRYNGLFERYDTIKSKIENIIDKKRDVPRCGYVVAYDSLDKEMVNEAGGKNSTLGELKSKAKMPVPDGFAITTAAYGRFMEHNGLVVRINEKLSAIPINDLEKLKNVSREIQSEIIGAAIPQDVEKEINSALERLASRLPDGARFSVRSSAIEEDSEFSFAGQYNSFLNVASSEVLRKYKEVIASLFSARAIFYYKTKGFSESDLIMPVGVMEMIDAGAAGVMYSLDPTSPDENTILINSVKGLGVSVVDGSTSPDTYVLAKTPEVTITGKDIARQKSMVVCSPGGAVEDVDLDSADNDGKGSLTDAQVTALAQYALQLEQYFHGPQDIEWALDKNGRFYILQARPLTVFAMDSTPLAPSKITGHAVLIDKGVIASRGIGHGIAYFVKNDDDLKDFPDGGILIAKKTSPKFVTVMNRAKAIITDVGGRTGHMASLAREYQVPAILDTIIATETIKHGQEITVDAINGNVYDGYVKELAEFPWKKHDPFMDTVIYKTLSAAVKYIVPLNLANPEAENFTPDYCDTYHDITRFAHEKAMHEMFNISDTSGDAHVSCAKKLITTIPVSVLLVDLGNAIDGSPKRINPEHVLSIPFNAFHCGLAAMRWPQARPLDVKGFLGMVAHSASLPESQFENMGLNSYAFISKNYMNFSIRLGYHLSTIEAFASEQLNDNYIKFHFKGGGAVVDRRLRRVRLITEILRALHFEHVRIYHDVIDASTAKYKMSSIMHKLEVLGKLTAYTKQLDMIMYNDAITEHYVEEFVQEHIHEEALR